MSDILLNQLPTNTDPERLLLFFKILINLAERLLLIGSPDGHRICLGNWIMPEFDKLLEALTASDTAEVIEAVLLNINPHLLQKIDSNSAASLPSAYTALLRYFHRKFKLL